MKKIGVLTLFNYKNYGNRLQAYALMQVLQKMKCKPVEVSYCKKRDFTYLVESCKTKKLLLIPIFLIFKILREKNLNVAIRQSKRLSLFLNFGRKMKNKVILSDSNRFDYYICGSDQIWNPDFAGEACFFADFASEEKRISYAASFGVSDLLPNYVDRYKKLLSGMSCISVRENEGAQIVKQLIGKDVPVLIDPTLMLDQNEWKAVARKPETEIPDNYVLVYFLGYVSSETKSFIDTTAQKNNLKVIILNELIDEKYWNITGPAEFIWLIENASLVCTDSFHASVFSILLQTPFIAFHRCDDIKDMHSRLENLLDKFNLTDRFFENIKEDEMLKCDYSGVSEKLTLEREKAMSFLTDSLNLINRKDEK